MEEFKDIDKVTLEQRKDLIAALSAARSRLLWIGVKSGLAIFVTNFVAVLIGVLFLVDANPDFCSGYQLVSVVINAIFVARYFNSQMTISSDILNNKIKEILKK